MSNDIVKLSFDLSDPIKMSRFTDALYNLQQMIRYRNKIDKIIGEFPDYTIYFSKVKTAYNDNIIISDGYLEYNKFLETLLFTIPITIDINQHTSIIDFLKNHNPILNDIIDSHSNILKLFICVNKTNNFDYGFTQRCISVNTFQHNYNKRLLKYLYPIIIMYFIYKYFNNTNTNMDFLISPRLITHIGTLKIEGSKFDATKYKERVLPNKQVYIRCFSGINWLFAFDTILCALSTPQELIFKHDIIKLLNLINLKGSSR